MGGRVRQHCHEPCVLQRDTQAALMLGTGACLAARLNLASIREIASEARDVLVVYLTHMVNAELTDLPPRAEVSSASARPPRRPTPVVAWRPRADLWRCGSAHISASV